MRFADFFAAGRGPVISFEVFPPKTEAGNRQLLRTLPRLVALRPSYITVTYGAFGGARQRTLEVAAKVKQEYGTEAACHLTCVALSRPEIDRMLTDIRSAGIENIVALRGDPPQGAVSFRPPPDGYSHANQLVEHIRRFEARSGLEPFGIAVAGYPEKHVEAPDMATDLANLKRKVDAGADVVMTQLFFDNADYFRFVEAARGAGIERPIVPGLLPILSTRQIRRLTSMCGARIPPGLQADLEGAEEDDAKAQEIGVRHCLRQATDLLRRGAPGIHFYVLNRATHIVQVFEELRPVIEEVSGK